MLNRSLPLCEIHQCRYSFGGDNFDLNFEESFDWIDFGFVCLFYCSSYLELSQELFAGELSSLLLMKLEEKNTKHHDVDYFIQKITMRIYRVIKGTICNLHPPKKPKTKHTHKRTSKQNKQTSLPEYPCKNTCREGKS